LRGVAATGGHAEPFPFSQRKERDVAQEHPEKNPDRGLTHGSGGVGADAAVEGKPNMGRHKDDDRSFRPAERLKDDEKHDQLRAKEECAEDRQEALIDEAVEETFPGSDPISPHHIT
jgi:hypothetical protein